jgi:hypothetical protein
MKNYYWENMKSNCRRYATNCSICRRSKAYKTSKQELLTSLSISQRKWLDISLDFVTELPECRRRNQVFENICHEMWLLIILRMRKSCINDKTIAKIMIIRERFYSKDVMWSILRYNTSLYHSHILLWRWIILIELIEWLQSLSKNSIIIKTRNLIIRLTI